MAVGCQMLNRGQRGGAVIENAPADHLALSKRIRLAVSPDDLDSAARARRMDFRVEDDVLPRVAQVAVGPAVVLPFLDPATEKLADAVKPAEDAEPRHVHAGRVDFDVRVEQVQPGRKARGHLGRNGVRVPCQRSPNGWSDVDALQGFVCPAHDLHVLLRHRPRSIPQTLIGLT